MVWKRNSALWLLMCFAAAAIAQDPASEAVADSVEAYPEETMYNPEMVHPGGQEVFEKEPLQGRKADMKAMEARVEGISYAETQTEAVSQQKFKQPEVDVPQNIGRFKDIIFWTAVVILVGVLAYLLFKTGKRNRYLKKGNLAGPLEWEEAWNLDVNTLEVDLQDAVESGNFRLAIRLLYLKNLKQLIDKAWVKPSPEKTNLQYRAELETAGLGELFGLNTRVYETVWYGEASPDSGQYRKISPSFHELYERSRK